MEDAELDILAIVIFGLMLLAFIAGFVAGAVLV
jgi:hypothetical protein